ncbi:YjhX family toxin [Phenylobacterium aquaticum]|uniref:YjhX family toxin n=1 Tax=Phenylobacterium aquaticum TaxID=1763816 RepID=UPI0026F265C0|nr:YjhX family toxin [Phenylobacterium aquaticum]
MNISKPLQRTLHALAQGGVIVPERDERGTIIDAECLTREGWRLADCDLALFKDLKRKKLISSQNGRPYRITREGLINLRAQLDNRTSSRGW